MRCFPLRAHQRRRAAVLATAGLLAATVTMPSAALGRQRSAAEPPTTATTTRLTKPSADAVITEIAERTWTPNAKHYNYEIWYDPDQNAVVVSTDAPEQILAPLRATHPGQVLTQPGGPITLEADRFNDESPYFGAGSITDLQNECTAGVAIIANDRRYLTTANHCFPNTLLYTQSERLIGIKDKGSQKVDTGLISGKSYSPKRIWVGTSPDDTASMIVSGAGSPSVGLRDVCLSGQTTFYHCGKTVTQTGVTECFENKTVCFDNTFIYEGAPRSGGGDSGAPVFTVSSGQATIIGLHIGKRETDPEKMIAIPIQDVLTEFTARLAAGTVSTDSHP